MRRDTLPWLLVVALAGALVVGGAPRLGADARQASPVTSPVSSPVASPAPEKVCEEPEGVLQSGQLEGRTTRQEFLASDAQDVAYRLEAGQICIEPGAVIPNVEDDCPPDKAIPCVYRGEGNDYVAYGLASTIYLESGRLLVGVRAGTVVYYADPVGATPVPGRTPYRGVLLGPGDEVELTAGDAVFVENVELRIENPDATTPAVIFATGFYPSQGAPGCAGQACWIPS